MNAFDMYKQAMEGDFTAGRSALDYAAQLLAQGWLEWKENPNNPTNYYAACNEAGFEFDNLLPEEVDYLSRRTQNLIDGNL